jgi:tRNA (uracil-5-)-methyltransferase TRM9
LEEYVVQELLALNRAFYARFAEAFVESRARPQQGFHRLVEYLPKPCDRLLDVGCGDGRLGRFLIARRAMDAYVGVDFSEEMLAAADTTIGQFLMRDLSQAGSLDSLGEFEAVTCLSTLQHIPGRTNRQRLVAEMAIHLAPGGRLVMSNWQFTTSRRQRKKVADWSTVGLTREDVEPGDYLLTWQRDGRGYRYVCLIDPTETADLAESAGLTIVDQFRSDGREGNLNLYTVLRYGP